MAVAIFEAIRDLIKYYAVSLVSTGDKGLDAALNTAIIAVIIYVFSYLNANSFEEFQHARLYRNLTNINQVRSGGKYFLDKFTDVQKSGTNFYKVISKKDHTQLSIVNYLIEQYYHSRTITFDVDSDYFNNGKLYRLEKPMLLFVMGNDILYIDPDHRFIASSEKILNEFMVHFTTLYFVEKSKNPTTVVNDTMKTLKIVDYESDVDKKNITAVATIYPNRCFDEIVSKWKKPVISLLDKFIYNNSHNVRFASYNLGFIFNGVPGTGKTNFIKSIANYLGRSVLTVNMNLVTTTEMFSEIIDYAVKNEIIVVLDEFDCVQDVWDSRENHDDSKSNDDVLTKLTHARHSLMNHMKSDDNKIIADELSAISKKILEYKNRLTLGSILTVLDGIDEQRGRVIIACTNYIDRIDSALLRPGRFDLSIKLEKFDQSEMYEMINMMALAKFDVYIEEVEFLRYTPADVINRVQKSNPQTPEELVALFTPSE